MQTKPPLFSQIVRAYRTQQGFSLRTFAHVLSSSTSGKGISHETIRNWEKGTHIPAYHTLLPLALLFGDWRRDFAFDALAALQPQLYTPMGEIGKMLLATHSFSALTGNQPG